MTPHTEDIERLTGRYLIATHAVERLQEALEDFNVHLKALSKTLGDGLSGRGPAAVASGGHHGGGILGMGLPLWRTEPVRREI